MKMNDNLHVIMRHMALTVVKELMENTKCIRLQRKILKMLHLLLYAMRGTFLLEPRLYYVVTMASSIDYSMLLY